MPRSTADDPAQTIQARHDAPLSAGLYVSPVLNIYDAFVLGFSNDHVWRCPSQQMLELYHQHVSAQHLEIGVGTGYFLDRCRFPVAQPRITLLDLNPTTLRHTTQRIARLTPAACVADALEPLPLAPASFDSIGLNYVLHCLPTTSAAKSVLVADLVRLLRPGGVLFGATILGAGVPHSPLARLFLATYHRLGVFTNRTDQPAMLEQALRQHFRSYDLRLVGSVALFVGQV